MFEADFMAVLMPLVGNRVWWNTLSDGMAVSPNAPVIVLQSLPGKATQYVEKDAVPSHKNMRIQVSILGDELLTGPLSRLVQDTLVQSAFNVEVYGGAGGSYDQDANLVGTEQQFGVWFPDP